MARIYAGISGPGARRPALRCGLPAVALVLGRLLGLLTPGPCCYLCRLRRARCMLISVCPSPDACTASVHLSWYSPAFSVQRAPVTTPLLSELAPFFILKAREPVTSIVASFGSLGSETRSKRPF